MSNGRHKTNAFIESGKAGVIPIVPVYDTFWI
jgi:hypothetical protein